MIRLETELDEALAADESSRYNLSRLSRQKLIRGIGLGVPVADLALKIRTPGGVFLDNQLRGRAQVVAAWQGDGYSLQ